MGLAGIGIGKLLIILVIVLLFFGTKRLQSLGGDLGGAIKGFKKAISDEEDESSGEPKKVSGTDKNDPNQSKSETK